MARGERRLLEFQTIVDAVNIYCGLVWRAVEGVRDELDAVSQVEKGGSPAFFIKNWNAYRRASDFEWELRQLCKKYEEDDGVDNGGT